MTADEFRNALLLLNCIDADEFSGGLYEGVFWEDSTLMAAWRDYRKDPVKFYIHAGDADRKALWSIIQKRLTIGEKNE